MKVILVQDFKSLGKKGDLAEVNDGYARNFLIPKKIAVEATKDAQNLRVQRLANEQKRLATEKASALELYAKLNGQTFIVPMKCNNGKMYGSVTSQDVASALGKNGFEVDKKKVTIKSPIKALGTYTVEVWCYKETVAKVNISVTDGTL